MKSRFLALLLLLGLAIAGPAGAAVTANNFVTPQLPNNGSCTFVQGTDTAGTFKTCYTGGANGSKILAIIVSSNDTVGHPIEIAVSTSTTAHCSPISNCVWFEGFSVFGSANFQSTASDFLNTVTAGLPTDNDNNHYLILKNNTQTIEATFQTALTASTQVTVYIIAVDF